MIIPQFIMSCLFQLNVQSAGNGAHCPAGIRTLRLPVVTNHDMPGLRYVLATYPGSQDYYYSGDSSRDKVSGIVQSSGSFSQVFIFSVIAYHSVKGIDDAVSYGSGHSE